MQGSILVCISSVLYLRTVLTPICRSTSVRGSQLRQKQGISKCKYYSRWTNTIGCRPMRLQCASRISSHCRHWLQLCRASATFRESEPQSKRTCLETYRLQQTSQILCFENPLARSDRALFRCPGPIFKHNPLEDGSSKAYLATQHVDGRLPAQP